MKKMMILKYFIIFLILESKCIAQSDSLSFFKYDVLKKYNSISKKYETQSAGKTVVFNHSTKTVIVTDYINFTNDMLFRIVSNKYTMDKNSLKHHIMEAVSYDEKTGYNGNPNCILDMYKDGKTAVYKEGELNHFKCNCKEGDKFVLEETKK